MTVIHLKENTMNVYNLHHAGSKHRHPTIPPIAQDPSPFEFAANTECLNCHEDFVEHEITNGKLLCSSKRS